MESIIISFTFISCWISISSIFNKIIISTNEEIINSKKNISLALSLGFIILFASLGGLNILMHLFKISIKYNHVFIITPVVIFLLNRKNIIKFYEYLKYEINNIIFTKNKYEFKKNPLLISLIIIIIIQCIILFIRYLLPVTHGDALLRYFYESLQISRLENIGLIDYYNMGFTLKTDSLASFFDALILQLTDNWLIVRTIRLISLFLIILNGIELTLNLGNINLQRSILLIAIILTTPDVWDLALSGKHDIYIALFELTSIYSIFQALIHKKKLYKLIYSYLSLFICIISVNSRLSSITLLVIASLFFFYIFFTSKAYLYYKKVNLPSATIIFSSLIILLSVSIIGIINYKYFLNPFYPLSPPEFLNSIFPEAISVTNYESFKSNYVLRNIPKIIKPFITIFYGTLALEPIRYVINKLQDITLIPILFTKLLNFIGPKDMLVSILSLSPFTLVPFFKLNLSRKNIKQFFLIIILFWLFLWTLSIPYTRVAIACSISLIVFALSEPINNLGNPIKNSLLEMSKNIIIVYGLLTIYLFSFWSISRLWDFPVTKLFNINYDRRSLTREYISLTNTRLGDNAIVPSEYFEKEWDKIVLQNNDSYLFLVDSPRVFAYFMNKGLITTSKFQVKEDIQDKALCFQIDNNQKIMNINCK